MSQMRIRTKLFLTVLALAVPMLLALFYNRKYKSPAGSLGPLIIVAYSTTVLISTCLCLYDRYWHIQ